MHWFTHKKQCARLAQQLKDAEEMQRKLAESEAAADIEADTTGTANVQNNGKVAVDEGNG